MCHCENSGFGGWDVPGVHKVLGLTLNTSRMVSEGEGPSLGSNRSTKEKQALVKGVSEMAGRKQGAGVRIANRVQAAGTACVWYNMLGQPREYGSWDKTDWGHLIPDKTYR